MIKSATKIWSSGKLKISGLFFIAFFCIAAGLISDTEKQQTTSEDDKPTVLVLPFSKYGFFAPRKTMEALREGESFDINTHVNQRFTGLLNRLNEIDCDFQFSSLENEEAMSIVQQFRFNKEGDLFVLDTQSLPEDVQSKLSSDVDYILVCGQYHIDADIESKQPTTTIYYDLRKSDLSPLGASKATGKLYQNKILDPKERESLVLNDLAKKLCQNISKKH